MGSQPISRFLKVWHTASLSAIFLPLLVFLTALFMRIDEEVFRDACAALFVVYFITVGVIIKLMAIVHNLFTKGKLLPIRFLLACFAIYSLVLVIMVGYVPEIVRGDMFMDEFAMYNVQVGVLLFHTAFLSLLISVAFSLWITRMIRQRAKEERAKSASNLNSAVKEDMKEASSETDYVQVL
eukprot:scaffold6052_cov118-Cylindrotheca_fusiformis.AAC.10